MIHPPLSFGTRWLKDRKCNDDDDDCSGSFEKFSSLIPPKSSTCNVQFGFEKMQSFSGAISQLNIWSKKLSNSQMRALSQCSGRRKKHFQKWRKLLMKSSCSCDRHIFETVTDKLIYKSEPNNYHYRFPGTGHR